MKIDLTNIKGTAGAPEGNQNAKKFKTPEQRKALCQAYCAHVKTGLSDESFLECDMQTLRKYLADYPIDFDTDSIESAKRERLRFWENIGLRGTVGVPVIYKGKEYAKFNADAWKFNMQNRFKWKIREDVTSDDEKIEIPQVIIDSGDK